MTRCIFGRAYDYVGNRDEGSARARAGHGERVLDGRRRAVRRGRTGRAVPGSPGGDRAVPEHGAGLRAQPRVVARVLGRPPGWLDAGRGGGRLPVRHLATGSCRERHRHRRRRDPPGGVDGEPAPGGGVRLLRLPRPQRGRPGRVPGRLAAGPARLVQAVPASRDQGPPDPDPPYQAEGAQAAADHPERGGGHGPARSLPPSPRPVPAGPARRDRHPDRAGPRAAARGLRLPAPRATDRAPFGQRQRGHVPRPPR